MSNLTQQVLAHAASVPVRQPVRQGPAAPGQPGCGGSGAVAPGAQRRAAPCRAGRLRPAGQRQVRRAGTGSRQGGPGMGQPARRNRRRQRRRCSECAGSDDPGTGAPGLSDLGSQPQAQARRSDRRVEACPTVATALPRAGRRRSHPLAGMGRAIRLRSGARSAQAKTAGVGCWPSPTHARACPPGLRARSAAW